MSDPSPHGPIRSFGRIKSRALKPRQAALFDTLLPKVALPDPADGPLDPAAIMPEARAVWLEIGFGGGEHLAGQAARHPDTLMIGCEPFLNGVGSALRHIDEGGLKNVRIHADDARAVIAALPDASVDHVLILFPDPWHKARHAKRRLVQADVAAELKKATEAFAPVLASVALSFGSPEIFALMLLALLLFLLEVAARRLGIWASVARLLKRAARTQSQLASAAEFSADTSQA